MNLRTKLEGIKTEKAVKEEKAAREDQLSEQEASQLEEQNFLEAHTRKQELAGATHAVQGARSRARQALGKRKHEFRNITSLMAEIQAEDPAQDLPSFKEVIERPEEGSDEENYARSKEVAVAAIAELREQKEQLKALGVDAEGLSDDELVRAVRRVQEDADAAIQEFLVQNPTSELPEAVQERAERVAALERKIDSLTKQMQHLTEWGRKYVSLNISSWDGNPEGLVTQLSRDIASDQERLDEEEARLVQADLYRDLLDGTGIMEDPEVKRTYEPAVTANQEVQALEEEIGAIKRKPTSRFFGYTESKKQEELAAKQIELDRKKEEATRNSAAYNTATHAYGERSRRVQEIFRFGVGKRGGYEETKRKLRDSIQVMGTRIGERRENLGNATYYARGRRELMDAMEAEVTQMALLKGEKRDGE